jgi:hypothetical protein
LDNFDVIIKNTFLDVYKVDIFYNKSKLGICAKVGFRLVNLNVDYNSTFVEMGVNFVVLVSELESLNFFILMSLRVPMGNLNHKGKNNLLLVFYIHSIKFWRFEQMNSLMPFHHVERLTKK